MSASPNQSLHTNRRQPLGLRIAEDFADNKFTDGNYFSVIWESEHYRIVPYIYGSHWRHNWLVCWNIASMREGAENTPTQSVKALLRRHERWSL